LEVANGSRVFTVPEPMLRGAKLGSSMQLRAATVVGREGENVVIDGRDGPDYAVHPSYVIPLTPEQATSPHEAARRRRVGAGPQARGW
jgi:hypothetical protein